MFDKLSLNLMELLDVKFNCLTSIGLFDKLSLNQIGGKQMWFGGGDGGQAEERSE